MKFRKRSLAALLMAVCMVMTTPVMPVAAGTDETSDTENAGSQGESTDVAEESGTSDVITESATPGESVQPGAEDENALPTTGGETQATTTDPQNADVGNGETQGTETEEETGDETQTGDSEVVNDGIPKGDGTEEAPYLIGNAEELFWFAALVNGTLEDGTAQNAGAWATLTADIVLNEDIHTESVKMWLPIGWKTDALPIDVEYAGHFDGDGHSVSGVVISGDLDSNYNNIGFFGTIAEGGVVENLTLRNSRIRSDAGYGAGGIAYELYGTMRNCHNEADIEDGSSVAGVVVSCEDGGVIENCTNEGDIRGVQSGGIISDNSGLVKGCTNTGKIIGTYIAGGIAARQWWDGYISQSVNSGSVQMLAYEENYDLLPCGGVVGENHGHIVGCGNSGEINSMGVEIASAYLEAGVSLGGIAGRSSSGMLVANYNTGKIGRKGTNARYAGGIAGYTETTWVWNCYNAGEIIELSGFSKTSGAVIGMYTYIRGQLNAYDCYYLSGSAEKGYGEQFAYAPPARMAGDGSDTDIPVISSTPIEITQAQFSSGEMALRLNSFINYLIDVGEFENWEIEIERDLWRQNLEGTDRDLYPVTDPAHKMVYADYVKKCPDAPKVISSCNNKEETTTVTGDHDYHDDVPCSGCGAFVPGYELEKNANGIYEIDTADELYWFAAKVNGAYGMTAEPDADAVLTADIVVNEHVLDSSGQLAESPEAYRLWTPIGYYHGNIKENITQDVQYLLYQGQFDGNGHTISGLYCEGEANESVGLFGLIGENAVIKNVHVKDTYFVPAADSIGAGMGYGGIVGISADTYKFDPDSTPEDSAGPENVNIIDYAGILGCSFEGSVSANAAAGGIVGIVGKSTSEPYIIYDCENKGKITVSAPASSGNESSNSGNGEAGGGICGMLSGGNLGIIRCGNAGDVAGSTGIGGILGGNNWGSVTMFSVYNAGNITAVDYAGGLAGALGDDWVMASHSYGTVDTSGGMYEGALVGIGGNIMIQNCYYNTDAYEGALVGEDQEESTITDSMGYTEAEFASGMVGHKLNTSAKALDESLAGGTMGVTGDWWYQTLDVDSYPVLDTTHGAIVASGSEDNPEYSNPEEYTFTVTLTSRIKGGTADTVAPLEGGGNYKAGTKATIRAPWVTGLTFCGWFLAADNAAGYTGEAISPNLEYTFKVSEDTNLVAVYEPNGKATLRVEGTGFTVNDGAPQYGSGYNKSITLGETITLKYVGKNKFLYWKDEGGKILSKSVEYSFTLLGDTTVIPVYIDSDINGTGYALVEFVSDYGQVIMAETYGATSEIEFPAGPSKMGQVFKGWSMDQSTVATVESVREKMTEDHWTHITLTPLYESSGETYTITVIADNNLSVPVLYEGIEAGTVYTIKAPSIAGREFAYWSSDQAGEKKLSFSSYYGVKVSGDITLYAIYQDEGVEVEKLPTVAITGSESLTENDVNQLRFISSYDAPEGYSLQETGVIFSTDPVYGEEGAEDAFIIGGENVTKAKSSATERYGTYTLILTVGDKLDLTAYVRGYLIVKNESTGTVETIYSDISSGSYHSLKK